MHEALTYMYIDTCVPYIYGCICSSTVASLWGGVCFGGCRCCWGLCVKCRGAGWSPAAPSGACLPGWAEPRSRKISQILKRSRDRKSLSHPAVITGWPSSLLAGPTRVPDPTLCPSLSCNPVPRTVGMQPPPTTPSLHPKNNLPAVKKPTGATATAPAGFFTARRLFLGISPSRGFVGGMWGWGWSGGGPFSPPSECNAASWHGVGAAGC